MQRAECLGDNSVRQEHFLASDRPIIRDMCRNDTGTCTAKACVYSDGFKGRIDAWQGFPPGNLSRKCVEDNSGATAGSSGSLFAAVLALRCWRS